MRFFTFPNNNIQCSGADYKVVGIRKIPEEKNHYAGNQNLDIFSVLKIPFQQQYQYRYILYLHNHLLVCERDNHQDRTRHQEVYTAFQAPSLQEFLIIFQKEIPVNSPSIQRTGQNRDHYSPVSEDKTRSEWQQISRKYNFSCKWTCNNREKRLCILVKKYKTITLSSRKSNKK